MTYSDQAIQDVAMIARNAIDRIIKMDSTIEERIKKAVLAEREACARVCESIPFEWEHQPNIWQAEQATMRECAAAIRNRNGN